MTHELGQRLVSPGRIAPTCVCGWEGRPVWGTREKDYVQRAQMFRKHLHHVYNKRVEETP